jgi:deoxyribodipyrimidine photo-lyase
MRKTALVWFRQDLRIHDNPALLHAIKNDYAVIPVFIQDDINAGPWKRGAASRWWLHHSLSALNVSLDGKMIFLSGDAKKLIPETLKATDAEAVFWNRCYEPWRIARDKEIKEHLKAQSITVETFNASMLWEPWTVLKDDGTPYKVFTPFYRKGCLGKGDVQQPESAPASIPFADFKTETRLSDLALIPKINWYKDMEATWTPGETGAQKRLNDFLAQGLKGYKEDRNRPDFENISRLSPHLHFGEISPREVWHKARMAGVAQNIESDMDHFCSELGWREFSTYLLYHFPGLPWENLQARFNDFDWADHESEDLTRWQRGQTGIPIVDAGMRQLWQTGWMHNRVRMIVASLLVKNMLIHWHQGALWFWDTLVDADLGNNSASWQWVAGCGADAAPYFRIFNPVTQGQKFDPNGDYVRRYVPELKDLDNKYLHEPWNAPYPPANYPTPIVDLKTSRDRALEAFAKTKTAF